MAQEATQQYTRPAYWYEKELTIILTAKSLLYPTLILLGYLIGRLT